MKGEVESKRKAKGDEFVREMWAWVALNQDANN